MALRQVSLLHWLMSTFVFLITIQGTIAIVESYSPSLNGISFLPETGYYDQLPEGSNSIPYNPDFDNRELFTEAINYANTGQSRFDPEWRYETAHGSVMDNAMRPKHHHHGPDCPEHGMHSKRLSKKEPQYDTQPLHPFRQYEKSLHEPPNSERDSYQPADYYREIPPEYELLNNYNDGTYGKGANSNTYALPWNTVPRYNQDKWSSSKSGLSERLSGMYTDVDYGKASSYPQTYQQREHDDFDPYTNSRNDRKRLSYQTRTTYDPWSGYSKKSKASKSTDKGNSDLLHNVNYLTNDDRKLPSLLFEKWPVDSFQTYDRRAIDFGYGSDSYRSRSSYKELPEAAPLHFKTNAVLRAPYEIFPSKFFLSNYKPKRASYISSDAYRSRKAPLNDDFKNAVRSKDSQGVKFPYKIPPSNKETPVNVYKKGGHGEKSKGFYKRLSPFESRSSRANAKKKTLKKKKLAVGPQSRNPFAFDPCQQLAEGDYELYGDFRTLFPYAFPKCSFVKCANYRAYLNPCSTGTKNVAKSDRLSEGFCTELDLKGDCGYSMNRAEIISGNPTN